MNIVERIDFKEMKCSFCERRAAGAWLGKTDVFCCDYCATTVLPVLIADSISPITEKFYRQRDQALMSFWLAYALRLLRNHANEK